MLDRVGPGCTSRRFWGHCCSTARGTVGGELQVQEVLTMKKPTFADCVHAMVHSYRSSTASVAVELPCMKFLGKHICNVHSETRPDLAVGSAEKLYILRTGAPFLDVEIC